MLMPLCICDMGQRGNGNLTAIGFWRREYEGINKGRRQFSLGNTSNVGRNWVGFNLMTGEKCSFLASYCSGIGWLNGLARSQQELVVGTRRCSSLQMLPHWWTEWPIWLAQTWATSCACCELQVP